MSGSDLRSMSAIVFALEIASAFPIGYLLTLVSPTKTDSVSVIVICFGIVMG